jgi:hypothetical protein
MVTIASEPKVPRKGARYPFCFEQQNKPVSWNLLSLNRLSACPISDGARREFALLAWPELNLRFLKNRFNPERNGRSGALRGCGEERRMIRRLRRLDAESRN